MNLKSIRFRTTAIAVVAVSAVMAIAALGVVVAQRRQLTATIDAGLRQRADDIAALVRTADSIPPTFGASREAGFALLVDLSGRVLVDSPDFLAPDPVVGRYRIGTGEMIRTLVGLWGIDDPFRVLSRTVDTPTGPAALHVGTSYERVDESTEALLTSFAVSLPIVVLVLAGLVWWLVGRTLRPVESIRAEVADISASHLDRRVTEPATGDEISRLAATMNRMLARLEDSVSRQRRFVADASHELRSPLTRMRSEIEVNLHDASGESREHLESLLQEVVELQSLVDGLLHLARFDAAAPAAADRLDLEDLLMARAEELRAEGQIVVDERAISPVQAIGDGAQLTRAIRNLTDNAARYASSTVWLGLRETDGWAELTVADDGPGIPADEAGRIFERFGRLDDARSRIGGGTGLGLSIAREIISRHGGTITLDPSYTAGARFIVRLPTAATTSSPVRSTGSVPRRGR